MIKKIKFKKRTSISFQPQKRRIDFLLLGTVVFLCLFGLLMIFNASSVSAFRDFGDKYHYLRDQTVWFSIGLGVMFFFSFLDYHLLYNLALPGFLFNLVLLFLVFFPGIGIKALGARRWLDLGLFILQPSELVKLTLALYLSAWFTSREKGRVWAFLILLATIIGLVVLEPDLGTSVVIALSAISLYFVSGAPFFHFLLIFPLSFIGGLILSYISPYRWRRLLTFFNPSFDPEGASYHIRQVLIALGSGGFFGVGLGKSRQKYEYLPEAATDSIFAIIGEELGFIGGLALVAFFIFIIYRGIMIAIEAPDKFGQLLGCGIIFFLGYQILINLLSTVALLPLTGLPLPFISYGGSNLIINLAGIGILLNISRQRVKR